MTDVLIAGAGPAGSIAALVLARAGARVTLVDRARFPRDKLCGDTINPGAISILRRLALDHLLADGLCVDGMMVTGEGGVSVRAEYGNGQIGRALPRRLLDLRLLDAAIDAGVDFIDGALVQQPLIGDDGIVRGLRVKHTAGPTENRQATVTIAADGAHSRIARALRLVRTPAAPRRWVVGGIFRHVRGLSNVGEMHVRKRCYIGVAPLPGGLTNACVVSADHELLRQKDLLCDVLRKDPATAGRFDAATLSSGPVMLGPLALDAKGAGVPGLLLAGDAAGFIDPMTGDGLRFAFRGAELAATEVTRVLQEGWRDAHLRLAAARRQEFRAKWTFDRTLRAIAASPLAVRAAAAGAQLSPAVLRHAIRYAGDVVVAGA